jgi:3-deoxy-D-arabino-heptulosonate 7-phosphate (DAHP) synthase
MGLEGLKLLALAKQETGLPIITEVMAPGDVETVARYADILQVGARNMQNYSLLDEVGATDKVSTEQVCRSWNLSPNRIHLKLQKKRPK